MNGCCGTGNSVAAGIGEQSYDGRVCSRPAGGCYYHRVDQGHSGAKNPVAGGKS
jgi:hypothetical protein